jgi:hypothetical protein
MLSASTQPPHTSTDNPDRHAAVPPQKTIQPQLPSVLQCFIVANELIKSFLTFTNIEAICLYGLRMPIPFQIKLWRFTFRGGRFPSLCSESTHRESAQIVLCPGQWFVEIEQRNETQLTVHLRECPRWTVNSQIGHFATDLSRSAPATGLLHVST